MNMRTLILACIVLAAGAASECQADELVYKSTGPTGRVTYGWAPAPDAVTTEKIEVQTLSPAQRHAISQLREANAEAARAAKSYSDRRRAQWNQVERELRAAHADLRRAESALERDRALRTGDTLRNKNGGMRYTQAYFDRIAALEQRVTAARQRLDRAYDARDALK
jgi:hypothetical protein